MSKSNEFLEYQYKILCRLSEKKEIYLVMDNIDKQLYVKKKIRPSQIFAYQQLKKIFTNMDKEKQLQSTSLSGIFDLYEADGQYYVIEEYVNGITLQQHLSDYGTFLKDDAIRQMLSLCEGIALLHKYNLIHGDITDNNIIVTTDGDLKIIDYDAITELSDSASGNQRYGTAGFAAPEQFGFGIPDIRTDIYALGVIFNRMLTGQLPHEFYYHENAHIERILKNCLAVEKKYRYETVLQLINQLKEDEHVSFAKKIINALPGLQLKKTWQKIIMFFCYMILMYSSLAFTLAFIWESPKNPFSLIMYSLSGILICLFLIWAPFLFIGNVAGWDNRIAQAFHWQKTSCTVLRFLLALFSWIIGLTLTILFFIFIAT